MNTLGYYVENCLAYLDSHDCLLSFYNLRTILNNIVLEFVEQNLL